MPLPKGKPAPFAGILERPAFNIGQAVRLRKCKLIEEHDETRLERAIETEQRVCRNEVAGAKRDNRLDVAILRAQLELARSQAVEPSLLNEPSVWFTLGAVLVGAVWLTAHFTK